MKADIKKKWVEALRSGQYEQGTGALVIEDQTGTGVERRYCCLGVLCEVVGMVPMRLPTDDRLSYDGEVGELPSTVVAFTGLTEPDPKLNKYIRPTLDNEVRSLARFNDDGLTFPQIADVIDYFIEEER